MFFKSRRRRLLEQGIIALIKAGKLSEDDVVNTENREIGSKIKVGDVVATSREYSEEYYARGEVLVGIVKKIASKEDETLWKAAMTEPGLTLAAVNYLGEGITLATIELPDGSQKKLNPYYWLTPVDPKLLRKVMKDYLNRRPWTLKV